MKSSYEILLSLNVKHESFADMKFDEFEFYPDDRTKTLFRQHNLLLKRIKNIQYLLYQAEGNSPTSLDELENKELSFRLIPVNSDFYSITDTSDLPAKNGMVFFAASLNATLSPEKKEVYPVEFCYQFKNSHRPLRVKILAYRGSEIVNSTISDPQLLCLSVNLRQGGEGAYSIIENTLPPTSEQNTHIYSCIGSDFYGAVCFQVKNIMNPARIKDFTIQFKKINQKII